jgi:hypothetical protein
MIVFFFWSLTTIMFDHKKRFASHYPSVIITGHGCETIGGVDGLEDGDEGRDRARIDVQYLIFRSVHV